VLIVYPSLDSYYIFVFLWFIYIPIAEYYFSQTIGMKIVGTNIVDINNEKKRIKLKTALRRHVARIGMMWGVIGWIFMFLGKQYMSDYNIVDEKYSSIETDEEGWVKVHNNNQYKIIFMMKLFLKIEYSKLIVTFFAHLFVAVLYGSFLGLLAKEYGATHLLSISIQIFVLGLVTYVAYKEEVKRHYPFLKAIGVNLLGFVLWFGVAITKIYILDILALIVVLFAIRYKCKKCVEYKKYKF
jgi:hypothetical protein